MENDRLSGDRIILAGIKGDCFPCVIVIEEGRNGTIGWNINGVGSCIEGSENSDLNTEWYLLHRHS